MTQGAGLIDRDSDLYNAYVAHTEECDEFTSRVQEGYQTGEDMVGMNGF